MSTIPTTGVNLWCATSPYPWAGDPNFTNAWIADSRHMDSTGSVGTWSPHKGSVSLTQATGANKPTFSKAWGSANHGMLTFDGVNDFMIGDALAANVTGCQPFTMITSWSFTSAGNSKDVWRFNAASDTVSTLGFQSDTSTPAMLHTASKDDAGHLLVSVTSAQTSTSRLVHTMIGSTPGPGSPWVFSERINGVSIAMGMQLTGGSYTNLTVSRFTVGAFRGATNSQFAPMNLRAILFAPSALSAQQVSYSERYLISELA